MSLSRKKMDRNFDLQAFVVVNEKQRCSNDSRFTATITMLLQSVLVFGFYNCIRGCLFKEGKKLVAHINSPLISCIY